MYPYKNAGYWLWIYNEIEIARDKSMFIFNFLREQYRAGIDKMEWIPDEETESTITEKDIKVITADLSMRHRAIVIHSKTSNSDLFYKFDKPRLGC